MTIRGLVLTTLFLIAAAGRSTEVRLNFKGASVASEGVLELRPVDQPTADVRRVSVRIPGEVRVDIPEGSYVASLDADDWWMPSQIIETRGGLDQELRPLRVGTVAFTVPQALIGRTTVAFAISGTRPVNGESRCTHDGAEVRCAVPEGIADLRVSCPGYIPAYRSAAIVASGLISLGRLSFLPGASLTGTLVSEEGPLSNVYLTLAPRDGTRRTFEAKPNGRGLFSIGPLEPGKYTLLATQKGLISDAVQIEIHPAMEARLDRPLLLARPRRFEAVLSPPVNPTGDIWEARVVRVDGVNGETDRGTFRKVSSDGSWTADGLVPGDYELQVRPRGGPVWAVEPVTVKDALTIVFKTVEGLRFEGLVSLGDEPLPGARLVFGGVHTVNAIPWRSDEKGMFRGYMPATHGDRWTVTVKHDDPPVNSTLTDVVMRRNPDTGLGTINVDVPLTELQGEVVDEKGVPVSRPLITINPSSFRGPLTQVTGDESGAFRVMGLQYGRYTVAGTAFLRESDPSEVDLTEQDARIELRLQLKPYREWSGRIVATDGRPVPGARIFAAAADVETVVAYPTISNEDGRFKLLVPPDATVFDFLVAPTGYAYSFFRSTFATDLEIVVRRDGGMLLVDLPDDPLADAAVLHSGSIMSAQSFVSVWTASIERGQPGRRRVRIPQLEPGHYVVCPVKHPVEWNAVRATSSCRALFLAPHSEELVELSPKPD